MTENDMIPEEQADGIHYFYAEGYPNQKVEDYSMFEPWSEDPEIEDETEEEAEDEDYDEGDEENEAAEKEEDTGGDDEGPDLDKDNRASEGQEPPEGPEAPEGIEGAEGAGEAGAEAGAEAAGEAAAEAGAEIAGEAAVAGETAGGGTVAIGAGAVLLIILVICLLLWLFFIIYYATNPGAGSDSLASGVAFDCSSNKYSFPYANKDVPTIPKTHHDYSAIDLMSKDGQPLVAVTDGTVIRASSRDINKGGIGLTIKGNDGYYYYYAHLESLQSGIKSGKKLKAGDPVGKSGHSGNASASAPHLHFGISKGEQIKGFYPAKVVNPPDRPAQLSPWKTLQAWKKGECIVPGT